MLQLWLRIYLVSAVESHKDVAEGSEVSETFKEHYPLLLPFSYAAIVEDEKINYGIQAHNVVLPSLVGFCIDHFRYYGTLQCFPSQERVASNNDLTSGLDGITLFDPERIETEKNKLP
jgi:hypothetical protein